MFDIGDHVRFKGHEGTVIFMCDQSLSILLGDEFPKATQTRIVAHHTEWQHIEKISCDSK
jgi:hypothetical protein